MTYEVWGLRRLFLINFSWVIDSLFLYLSVLLNYPVLVVVFSVFTSITEDIPNHFISEWFLFSDLFVSILLVILFRYATITFFNFFPSYIHIIFLCSIQFGNLSFWNYSLLNFCFIHIDNGLFRRKRLLNILQYFFEVWFAVLDGKLNWFFDLKMLLIHQKNFIFSLKSKDILFQRIKFHRKIFDIFLAQEPRTAPLGAWLSTLVN